MLNINGRVKQQKGFTLIELLIVVAIIGILASIIIAGYIGMQERVRRTVLIATSASAESELQAWLNSALKGQSVQAAVIEVDTNGDAAIDTLDHTNAELYTIMQNGDLDQAYINARAVLYGELSPWFPGTPLWIADSAANGRISLVSSSEIPYTIRVEAWDRGGSMLHLKTVYAD